MKAYKCIMYVERNKKQGFKRWRIRRIEIYTGIYREQRDKRINSKCQRDREKKNNRIKNRGMENREIEIIETESRDREKSQIYNLELGRQKVMLPIKRWQIMIVNVQRCRDFIERQRVEGWRINR